MQSLNQTASVPFFSLPTELQTEILSFAFKPKVLQLVCRSWRDLTHSYAKTLLEIFESQLGLEKTSQIYQHHLERRYVYHWAIEKAMQEGSELQKLMSLDQQQREDLKAIFSGHRLVNVFEPEISFAQYNAIKQWLNDYNFFNLCLSIEDDLADLCSKANNVLKSIYLENQMKLDSKIDKLRDLFKDINFQSLEILNCKSQYMTEIPKEIIYFSHLRTLYLRNNCLKELPCELSQLSHLEALDLSNNEFSKIPSVIGKLSHLTDLSLNGNPLLELSSELENLPRLNVLYISSRFGKDPIIQNLIEKGVQVYFN